MVFLLFVVLVLAGLLAAAVMGKISGFMADPTSSQSFGGLPAGSLSSLDSAQLRFDRALRGYRMDQVDDVIDALRARLSELEDQVASFPTEQAPLPAAGDSSAVDGDSHAVGTYPQEP